MAGRAAGEIDVVIPTLGRPTLARLLDALAPQRAGLGRVIVIDDRGSGRGLELGAGGPAWSGGRPTVVPGPARGPAAARNAGWEAAGAEWIAFLDDDVVPAADWAARLREDLAGLPPAVAGSQGEVRVPLPARRPPTDWERNVAGLAGAHWITADIAYRRAALAAVGGFDERFGGAYREDTDLALRLLGRGWQIVRGERRVEHPVGSAGFWVSVGRQRGNADDVLMRTLHGRHWRRWGAAPRGRLRRHLLTSGAGLGAVATLALARTEPGRPLAHLPGVGGRPRFAGVGARGRGSTTGGDFASTFGRLRVGGERPGGPGTDLTARRTAAALAATWAALTAELAWARIAPGPRDRAEVGRMAATSAFLPFAASAAAAIGALRLPLQLRRGGPGGNGSPSPVSRGRPRGDRSSPPATRPEAVLLDRDGTLIVDIPYNGDPGLVEPMPGAAAALERLRAAGIALAVVSNQSGIGRGLIGRDQVDAVNRRAEELLGPLGIWHLCPHVDATGCECRKPAPGLIRVAAAELGLPPDRCAVLGDIAADVQAAETAGAAVVMVPTPRTEAEDVRRAPHVEPTIEAAVDYLLALPPAHPREVATSELQGATG